MAFVLFALYFVEHNAPTGLHRRASSLQMRLNDSGVMPRYAAAWHKVSWWTNVGYEITAQNLLTAYTP